MVALSRNCEDIVMKPHRFLSVLLALVFVLPVVVRADAVQDARRAIQSRYDQFDRAYMKKDFRTVAEVFTPKCMLKLSGEGRSMSASRVIQGMEALSRSLTISHARTQILSVNAAGTEYEVTAVWTGNSTYVPVSKSKEDPARRSRTKQNVRDTWQKTDKGWQIRQRIIEDAEEDTQPKAIN
jgi:hypothetical protein